MSPAGPCHSPFVLGRPGGVVAEQRAKPFGEPHAPHSGYPKFTPGDAGHDRRRPARNEGGSRRRHPPHRRRRRLRPQGAAPPTTPSPRQGRSRLMGAPEHGARRRRTARARGPTRTPGANRTVPGEPGRICGPPRPWHCSRPRPAVDFIASIDSSPDCSCQPVTMTTSGVSAASSAARNRRGTGRVCRVPPRCPGYARWHRLSRRGPARSAGRPAPY